MANLAFSIALKESFNGDGAVVSYLNIVCTVKLAAMALAGNAGSRGPLTKQWWAAQKTVAKWVINRCFSGHIRERHRRATGNATVTLLVTFPSRAPTQPESFWLICTFS
jgi:hypothetical protein